MEDAKKQKWLHVSQQEFVHAVRTAIAAVASLLIARLFRLPEAYWAAIATMMVMQSTLGAAWTISKDRLAGTALGAAAGALLQLMRAKTSRCLAPACSRWERSAPSYGSSEARIDTRESRW